MFEDYIHPPDLEKRYQRLTITKNYCSYVTTSSTRIVIPFVYKLLQIIESLAMFSQLSTLGLRFANPRTKGMPIYIATFKHRRNKCMMRHVCDCLVFL